MFTTWLAVTSVVVVDERGDGDAPLAGERNLEATGKVVAGSGDEERDLQRTDVV